MNAGAAGFRMRSLCTRFAPILASIAFLAASHDAAGNGMNAGVCDCQPLERYTLNVSEVRNPDFPPGTITRIPDQPDYAPNEFVMIEYTPGEKTVLDYWDCNPNSNIASGSKSTQIGVFMIADIGLAAHAMARYGKLAVCNLDYYPPWPETVRRGDLEVPAGATEYHCSYGKGFWIDTEYGDVFDLLATPAEGRIAMWTGVTMVWDNSVTVKALPGAGISVQFGELGQNPPVRTPPEIEVIDASGGNGTADAYAVATMTPWSNAPVVYPFLANVDTSASLVVGMEPQPDYYFCLWTWMQDGDVRYSIDQHITTNIVPEDQILGYIAPGIRLATFVEGKGAVVSSQFWNSWNPYPFHEDTLGQISQGIHKNGIALEGRPCPGWYLDHWETLAPDGEWAIIEDAQGNPVTGDLLGYMNWWPCEDEHFHVPHGQTVTSAKAVFEPYCGAPDCEGPDGREIVRGMYENPNVRDGGGSMYTPKPSCDLFVTNIEGHSLEFYDYEEMTYTRLSCEHSPALDAHPSWQVDDGASALFRRVRDAYGAPLRLTSVYRCPRHNTAVDSKATSQHAKGTAFDYNVQSTAGNWAVAVAAESVPGGATIFLYRTSGHAPEDMATPDELRNCAGCDPPNILPPGWGNGIFHGHIDAR